MAMDKQINQQEEVLAALYLEQVQLAKYLPNSLYLKLLARFGSAKAIMQLSKAQLQATGLKASLLEALYPRLQLKLNRQYQAQAQACYDYCQREHVNILTYGCAEYPVQLSEIYQPPSLLYCLGNTELLGAPQIAIVGARKASQAGLNLAHQFAQQLAQAGWVITSGLALGVDASAHKGALAAPGQTIAVLPCGIDLCYPARHRDLAVDIMQQGLLVSEFALGSNALRAHFPRRNRLISGLSLGTLVVEAQIRSGSLITARLALEQNKEVFALPAGINNPYGQGCNQLIQMGAKLVTQVSDISAEFSSLELSLVDNNPIKNKQLDNNKKIMVPDKLSVLQQNLYLSLLDEPLSLEELLIKQPVSFFDLQQNLMQLELLGLVKQEFGRYLSLNSE